MGIKLLTLGILENFGSLSQFPGMKMPILPSLRTPMFLTYHEFKSVYLSSM